MNKRNSLFSDFDKALKQISNSEEEQDKLTKEKYKKLRKVDEEYSKQISNILIKREDMYKVYYKYQELIHKYSKFSSSLCTPLFNSRQRFIVSLIILKILSLTFIFLKRKFGLIVISYLLINSYIK